MIHPALGFDPQSIVTAAIRGGMLAIKVGRPPRHYNRIGAIWTREFKRQYAAQRRARLAAMGLTTRGLEHKPAIRAHPELSGLTGREYHREYMRLRREHFVSLGLNTKGKERKC